MTAPTSTPDPRDQLSLPAQGVLALLQRHPELPSANREAVAAHSASGVTAANTALSELEQAGFLRRWRERRAGAAGGFDWPWALYPDGGAPSD